MADRHDTRATEIVESVRTDHDSFRHRRQAGDSLRHRIAAALRSEAEHGEERDAALVKRTIKACLERMIHDNECKWPPACTDSCSVGEIRALAAPEAVRKIVKGKAK